MITSITSFASLGNPDEIPSAVYKGKEIEGSSLCPNSYHGLRCYTAENIRPHHMWNLLEFSIRCLPEWIDYFVPLNEWEWFNLPWDSLVLLSSWNTLYMNQNTHNYRRGESGNTGLAYPAPLHLLMLNSAVSPDIICATYNQVNFLSFQLSLSQGQVYMTCFLYINHLQSFGPHLFHSIGLKDIIAHIVTLTKFT